MISDNNLSFEGHTEPVLFISKLPTAIASPITLGSPQKSITTIKSQPHALSENLITEKSIEPLPESMSFSSKVVKVKSDCLASFLEEERTAILQVLDKIYLSKSSESANSELSAETYLDQLEDYKDALAITNSDLKHANNEKIQLRSIINGLKEILDIPFADDTLIGTEGLLVA